MANTMDKLDAVFQDAEITRFRDTVTLTVRPEKLADTLTTLKSDPDFNCELLLDTTVVDYLDYPVKQEARFYVVYTLRNWEKNLLVQVRTPVRDPEAGVPTATAHWKSADWGEREAWDQYGVKFNGHHNLKRILNHHQFVGHPLRKDYPINKRQICYETDEMMDQISARLESKGLVGSTKEDIDTEIMFLNLGPSHPATHGALRTLAALDGETIVAACMEIGYLHRGFEKTAETKTYNQVVPLTDRLNYCSALMNNIGYVKAVEKFLGIEITPRCMVMRVILAELSRVIDHLVCLAANLVDMGGLTNYWYLYNQKEFVYDFLQRLTGARLTSTFTRVGGMYKDFYEGWQEDLEHHLQQIESGTNDSLKLVAKNRIFHDRTKDVCVFSAEQALSYGLTGPCLRASGVPYDLRKDAPYYNYDQFDFEIPVGSKGDIYDRMMVRYEEIFQSVKIVRQAMKVVPDGAIFVDDKRYVLPEKDDVYSNIEGLVNHFKLIFEGVKVPVGELYDGSEAANGELGFFIVSDGSGRPYKIKVRPPCFYMMSSFPEMVEGYMVADAVINLGSLNIIGGELDR
jgi:NADH-quinone oxidoreductase subunit C/D